MGWSLKGTPKTLKVTARLAKEFAEMEAAHVDRPLSERRLQVYRRVRASGGFRPVTWAKAWCAETEQFYRVNGKHTSTLFADGEGLDGLYAVVEEYACDTLEDVAKLYGTFDTQSQTRNATDVNRSFAATIPELAACDTRFVNLMVSALNFDPADPNHARGTPAERAEVLFDNVEVCVWAQDFLARSDKTIHLCRVPVAAALIATYGKSKSAAREFWSAVRDETGATPEAPDRKLARFLLTSASHHGAHKDKPSRFRVLPREFYCKCVKSWNAWRKGETTDLKYFVDAKIPALA